MVRLNYTSVRRREKRLYTFFNTTISREGITSSIFIEVFILLLIFAIPGLLICKITGILWYNPIYFVKGAQTGYFYLFFVGGPIGCTIALNTLKVQNYKLIDFLKIYFTPKIPRDEKGKKLKIHQYKIDVLIEKL